MTDDKEIRALVTEFADAVIETMDEVRADERKAIASWLRRTGNDHAWPEVTGALEDVADKVGSGEYAK